MGGNAGTQSLTVAVRAIATKDLTTSNVWRVIRREVLVGLLNGMIFAVVLGLVGYFWFGSSIIGWVLALAMVLNMVVAGLAGTVISGGAGKNWHRSCFGLGCFCDHCDGCGWLFRLSGSCCLDVAMNLEAQKTEARRAAFARRKRAMRRKAVQMRVYCQKFWPVTVVRPWRASCPLELKLTHRRLWQRPAPMDRLACR